MFWRNDGLDVRFCIMGEFMIEDIISGLDRSWFCMSFMALLLLLVLLLVLVLLLLVLVLLVLLLLLFMAIENAFGKVDGGCEVEEDADVDVEDEVGLEFETVEPALLPVILPVLIFTVAFPLTRYKL